MRELSKANTMTKVMTSEAAGIPARLRTATKGEAPSSGSSQGTAITMMATEPM
ncbi:putative testis-expressed sequence 2 protein-like protein [Cutibacterium acnes HL042PA3]|nr:putative testis-expressed sequence 2 protein-like protein [Cutibacterium acnes HL042PA3]